MRIIRSALVALCSILLFGAMSASGQELKSCDFINQWADFKSISVEYSKPGETSEVVFEHTKEAFEKLYRVTVSDHVDLQVVRTMGFTSYKSINIPSSADCRRDLGDTTSFLEGQIVRALYLLGRSHFDGPDAVEGTIQVNATVDKLMEKVMVNPGTSMRIPGPWSVSGTIERMDSKSISFDLVHKVPGWEDTRIKGVWSIEEKWPLVPNSELLSEWKVCSWPLAERAGRDTSSILNFEEMRQLSESLRAEASNQSQELTK